MQQGAGSTSHAALPATPSASALEQCPRRWRPARAQSERGWSVAALQAGARELGLSAAAAALVPGGEAGLVQFFVEQCNSRLAGELAARRAELAAMRVPDRIRTAVRRRLEMLVPVIGARNMYECFGMYGTLARCLSGMDLSV